MKISISIMTVIIVLFSGCSIMPDFPVRSSHVVAVIDNPTHKDPKKIALNYIKRHIPRPYNRKIEQFKKNKKNFYFFKGYVYNKVDCMKKYIGSKSRYNQFIKYQQRKITLEDVMQNFSAGERLANNSMLRGENEIAEYSSRGPKSLDDFYRSLIDKEMDNYDSCIYRNNKQFYVTLVSKDNFIGIYYINLNKNNENRVYFQHLGYIEINNRVYIYFPYNNFMGLHVHTIKIGMKEESIINKKLKKYPTKYFDKFLHSLDGQLKLFSLHAMLN